MLVEVLERLSELQGPRIHRSSKVVTSSGGQSSTHGVEDPGEKNRIPANEAVTYDAQRARLRRAAREAVDATEVGSANPPPPYDPREADRKKYGNLIHSW